MNIKTVGRAELVIRSAIAEQGGLRLRSGDSLDAPLPVFGIRDVNDKLFIEPLSEKYENLFAATDLKSFRKGRLLYTSRYNGYAALLAYSPPRNTAEITPNTNAMHPAFASIQGPCLWAIARLRSYHSISSRQFPLLLHEIAFRYNLKNEDFFDATADLLCRLVPDDTFPC